MTVLVVTGTDRAVGKTVVSAAVAVTAAAAGLRVAVLKPVQTGAAVSDVRAVIRLAAPATAQTLSSYPDPLAPAAAARESGRDPLGIGDVIECVTSLTAGHDLVLVVGTGGLLAPMGGGWTVADLAVAVGAVAVVVTRAALGTLNHTALTLEALARRRVPSVVVIGAWPAVPELVYWSNLSDIPGELVGVLPEGAGVLPPARFGAIAPLWLTPRLWGRADPRLLRMDGPRSLLYHPAVPTPAAPQAPHPHQHPEPEPGPGPGPGPGDTADAEDSATAGLHQGLPPGDMHR